MREWNELDEDVQGEVDVIALVTNRYNMVRDKITVTYSHAMIHDKKITLMYQNENNGSSATPVYWTDSWLTEKECMEDAIEDWSDSYDDALNPLKYGDA